MSLVKGLIVLTIGLHSVSAWADMGCAGTGQLDPNTMQCFYPDGSSGNYMYGNDAGYSGGTPTYIPPTVITLPDSWGAIAVGSSSAGMASKQTSKQTSKQLALQHCASGGASDCKVLEVYKNTCVVVADGVANRNYVTNPDVNQARQTALSGCKANNNGQACKIVYEECMYDHLYHP